MRIIFFILILIAILPTVKSQVRPSLESTELENMVYAQESIPVVEGILEHYHERVDGDIIVKYALILPGFKSQKSKVAKIDSNGHFSLVLEYGFPLQQVWISIGELYTGEVIVDKQVLIRADLKKLKLNPVKFYGSGITFEGEDGEMNMYLNRYEGYKKKKKVKLAKQKLSLMMNRSQQFSYKLPRLNKITRGFEKIENSYAKRRGDKYRWLLTNERLSKHYSDLLSFAIVKDIGTELWDECLSHEPLVMSNSGIQYYDILSFLLKERNNFKLESLTKKALKRQFYSEDELANLNVFLSEFERKNAGITYDKAIYDAGFDLFMREYELQLEKTKLEIFCDKLDDLKPEKASLVSIWGQPEEFAKRELYFEYIIPRLNLSWCEKFMRDAYKNDIEKIQGISGLLKTKIDPDSVYTLGKKHGFVSNGSRLFLSLENEPENLLTSIRNYYRGQNLVINLWSTWCGPCISDMQRSNYVSRDLENLPVRFIHLCIDDNTSISNWKEKVTMSQAKGDHIFLNKKLSAEIMSFFDFYEFPKYIYIDEDGNYDPFLIDGLSRIDSSMFSQEK